MVRGFVITTTEIKDLTPVPKTTTTSTTTTWTAPKSANDCVDSSCRAKTCFCGNDETRTRTRTCFENVPRKHNATGITGIRFWKEVCEMSPGQPPQIEADKNDCYIKYCNDKDMLKDMFCSGSNCTYTWQRSRCKKFYETFPDLYPNARSCLPQTTSAATTTAATTTAATTTTTITTAATTTAVTTTAATTTAATTTATSSSKFLTSRTLEQSANTTSSLAEQAELIVIGGVVGVSCLLLLLTAICCAVLLCRLCRRKKKEEDNHSKPARSETADIVREMQSRDDIFLPKDSIVRGQKFGSGGGGQIFRGMYGDIPVALKEDYTMMIQQDVKSVAEEAGILFKLRHPWVVTFYGLWVPDESQKNMYLVMELCAMDLQHSIAQSQTRPSAVELARTAQQMAAAVAYLHGRSPPVVHRDIKPQNVLLDKHGNCKLTDFGLSKILSKPDVTKVHMIGTLAYMPPEVMCKSEGDSQRETHAQSLKWDIYSLAMTFYYLFARARPFPSLTHEQVYVLVAVRGERPKLPDHVPATVKALIEAMWAQDREERPSAQEVSDRLLKFIDVTSYYQARQQSQEK